METKKIDLSSVLLKDLAPGLKVEIVFAYEHTHGTVVPLVMANYPDAIGIKDDRNDYVWHIYRDTSRENGYNNDNIFVSGFGGIRGLWTAPEPWTADDWNREICNTVRDRLGNPIRWKLSKAEWIEKYGGQKVLDAEGFEVVPCGEDCADSVCHGWKVVSKGKEN